MREIAEHQYAGSVFVALTLELPELRHALRLRLDERRNPFLVAGNLLLEHLPRQAEETTFGQALESRFQRNDHPAVATPSRTVASTDRTRRAQPFARLLGRY